MAGFFAKLFSRGQNDRHAENNPEWQKARYHILQALLADNERAFTAMAEADRLLYENDAAHLAALLDDLCETALELADGLNRLTRGNCRELYPRIAHLRAHLAEASQRYGHAPRGAWLPLASVTPDMREEAGGKALPLAGLIRAGMTVPDGFVIPLRSCREYLREARLEERLGAILFDAAGVDANLDALSKRARSMILASDPSERFAAEMQNAWESLAKGAKGTGGRALSVSVRSSASGEDGREHSFAGQYTSVLGVSSPEAFMEAFKEVLAGAFSQRAMAYRIKAGQGRQSVDMAVLCQRMVNARTAGVLFTMDPMVQNNRMLLTAVPGLGELAVSGRAPADTYHPSRNVSGDADGDMPCEIAVKTHRVVPAQGGGVRLEEVDASQAKEPLLTSPEVEELRLTALRIEALAGCVQDIEWSIDKDGILWILQARPAHLAKTRMGDGVSGAVVQEGGVGVSPGKAAGAVAIIHSGEDLGLAAKRDEPVIAVLRQPLTDVASFPPNLAGIVADSGDPLDRMACQARENAIPMITGLGTATSVLKPGQWVLADGDRGTVLEADPRLWKDAPRPRLAVRASGGDALGAAEAIRSLVMETGGTGGATPPPHASAKSQSPGDRESLRALVNEVHEKAVAVLSKMADAACAADLNESSTTREKMAALDRFLRAAPASN